MSWMFFILWLFLFSDEKEHGFLTFLAFIFWLWSL